MLRTSKEFQKLLNTFRLNGVGVPAPPMPWRGHVKSHSGVLPTVAIFGAAGNCSRKRVLPAMADWQMRLALVDLHDAYPGDLPHDGARYFRARDFYRQLSAGLFTVDLALIEVPHGEHFEVTYLLTKGDGVVAHISVDKPLTNSARHLGYFEDADHLFPNRIFQHDHYLGYLPLWWMVERLGDIAPITEVQFHMLEDRVVASNEVTGPNDGVILDMGTHPIACIAVAIGFDLTIEDVWAARYGDCLLRENAETFAAMRLKVRTADGAIPVEVRVGKGTGVTCRKFIVRGASGQELCADFTESRLTLNGTDITPPHDSTPPPYQLILWRALFSDAPLSFTITEAGHITKLLLTAKERIARLHSYRPGTLPRPW